jgi:ribosomal protein S18 acetylase RimI-like enzyme
LIGYWEIPSLEDTIETLKASDESFYGYFEDGKLLGVISYKMEGEVMDLCRLVVHPNYFRMGIGKKLLAYIANVEENITKLEVSTGSENAPAIALYKGYGFEETKVVEVDESLKLTVLQKSIRKI